MFRLFSHTVGTINSQVKLYQCSKDISVAVAHRVQQEQRAEYIFPKIFRAQNAIARGHASKNLEILVRNGHHLRRSTGNTACIEDIGNQVLQPYGVPNLLQRIWFY